MQNPYNLKPICQNCPFNITPEMRPEMCRARGDDGGGCEHYTECRGCGSNAELTDSLCAKCVADGIKIEADIVQVVEQQIAPDPKPVHAPEQVPDTKQEDKPEKDYSFELDDDGFSRDERDYFDRRMTELFVQQMDSNPTMRFNCDRLVRTEIRIKRLDKLLAELGKKRTLTAKHREDEARLQTLLDKAVKSQMELSTFLGVAPNQQAPETQYEKSLASLPIRFRELIQGFQLKIGMASKEEKDYALKQETRRQARMETPDGNGRDMSQYQVGLDGRLIGDAEALDQHNQIVAEFNAAEKDGDKKKALAVVMKACWLDPVIGSLLILTTDWDKWKPTVRQRVRLRQAWVTKLVVDLSGAGMGKSFIHAGCAMLRAVEFPSRRALIVSGRKRQGEQYYDKWEQYRQNSIIIDSQILERGGKKAMSNSGDTSRIEFKGYSQMDVLPPGFAQGAVSVRGEDVHDLYLSEINIFPRQELVETVLFMRARATWVYGGSDHPIFQNHFHLEGTPPPSKRDAAYRRIEVVDQVVTEWLKAQQ